MTRQCRESRGRRVGHMALGCAGLCASGALARKPAVGPVETAVFRAVNGLPDDPTGAVWLLMQCGSLGAVPAAAGVSWLSGRRDLSPRLALAGGATWACAKLVKLAVRRPRPADLMTGVVCRGSASTGLGYLSGHAGVVTALATVAAPALPRKWRQGAKGLVPFVAGARVYVGAHLPLDVVGGVALGHTIGALFSQ